MMNRNSFVIGLGAGLALASGSASAFIGIDSYANVGVSGGYTFFSLPDDPLHKVDFSATSGSDIKRHQNESNGHIAYGANMGFSVNVISNWDVGIDFAYNHNGEADYDYNVNDNNDSNTNDVSISSSDFDITGKLKYAFDNGFELYGKGGMARVSQDTDKVKGNMSITKNIKSSPSRSISEYAPIAGAGANFRFANGLGLGVSVDHIFGDSPSIEKLRDNGDRGKNVYSITRIMGDITYRFDMT